MMLYIGHSNAVKIADAVEKALVNMMRREPTLGDMTIKTMNKIVEAGREAALRESSTGLEELK